MHSRICIKPVINVCKQEYHLKLTLLCIDMSQVLFVEIMLTEFVVSNNVVLFDLNGANMYKFSSIPRDVPHFLGN